MENTVEGSKYHRERSVATHTDMVVSNLIYLNTSMLLLTSNDCTGIYSLFAAAFHDVGKPSMQVAKHSEARGQYFSFSGHELRSARLWENFIMSSEETNGLTPELKSSFGLDDSSIYKIGFMIEHHRPWGLKDQRKIDGLNLTNVAMNLSEVFFNLLFADNIGRMGDDHEENVTASKNKIFDLIKSRDELMELYYPNNYQDKSKLENTVLELADSLGINEPPRQTRNDSPKLHIPIAPSGAGKSTLYEDFFEKKEMLIHSMDLLRAELYGSDPAKAFKESINDSEFKSKVQADFIEKIKSGKDVYIDNTNLSRKRRRFYVEHANRHGYEAVAYLLPITLEELSERQKNRGDKQVPFDAVMRQYMALSYPVLGQEFDAVHVIT